MSRFKVYNDDQLTDVINLISDKLKKFGLEITSVDSNGEFGEYVIIPSDEDEDNNVENQYNDLKANFQLFKPSNELAEMVGHGKIFRTEVIKKIWDYIKDNDLQDKQNRRMINLDIKLKSIFNNGSNQISMFEMAKYLGKHLS